MPSTEPEKERVGKKTLSIAKFLLPHFFQEARSVGGGPGKNGHLVEKYEADSQSTKKLDDETVFFPNPPLRNGGRLGKTGKGEAKQELLKAQGGSSGTKWTTIIPKKRIASTHWSEKGEYS